MALGKGRLDAILAIKVPKGKGPKRPDRETDMDRDMVDPDHDGDDDRFPETDTDRDYAGSDGSDSDYGSSYDDGMEYGSDDESEGGAERNDSMDDERAVAEDLADALGMRNADIDRLTDVVRAIVDMVKGHVAKRVSPDDGEY